MNATKGEWAGMPEGAVHALAERITSLEGDFRESLRQLQDLILREIKDLKNEQLADMKAAMARIERDLKDEHTRLADDQRRLWERLNDLERRENQRIGAAKSRGSAWHIFSAMIGGLITVTGTAIVNWLSRGAPPPAH